MTILPLLYPHSCGGNRGRSSSDPLPTGAAGVPHYLRLAMVRAGAEDPGLRVSS